MVLATNSIYIVTRITISAARETGLVAELDTAFMILYIRTVPPFLLRET